MRRPHEGVVDPVEDGEQDVHRADALGGAGEDGGPGEDPCRRRRAGDPVVLVGARRPRTDEDADLGADRLGAHSVCVEGRTEAGHPTAERDGGEQEVLRVDGAEARLVGLEVAEQGMQ